MNLRPSLPSSSDTRRQLTLCLAVLSTGVLLSAGCFGSRQTPAKKQFDRPSIPVAPAYVSTAIDPTAQARATREIAQAFASSDPVLRAQSLESTARTIDPDAPARIERGLSDRESIVRFAAAMAAGDLRLRQLTPQLLVLANDADANVRVAVRYALHRAGDTRLSNDLEPLSQSLDAGVRGNAALVLGLTGESSAVRVLRPMLRDTSTIVRLQAAEAMWRLGDQRGLELLVSALVSRFVDDQMIALLGLASRRDTRVRDYLVGKLVPDKDAGQVPELQLAAARALGQIGDDSGFTIARNATRSDDSRQRQLAALALGDIARTDAQADLVRLLDDRDPTVRLAAATALRLIALNPRPQG